MAATGERIEAAGPRAPVVAGWIEHVPFPDHRLAFDAKLDTGADTSSLNAERIERFRRGRADWVRFTLRDDAMRETALELPVERRVRIRRSGSDGDRRMVVRLTICLAGRMAVASFTLANRGDLKYQVLIGRNVLGPNEILVDSARPYTVGDRCPLPH